MLPKAFIIMLYFEAPFFALLMALFTYYMYAISKKQNLEKKIDEENKQLREYAHLVASHQEGMQQILDGYNATLQKIGHYIYENDIEEIKKIIDEEMTPLYHSEINDALLVENLSHLGIIELKGIIYARNTYAINSGVNFNLRIGDKFNTIQNPKCFANEDVIDLAKILGVLLDNAIEAASESHDKIAELYIFQDAKTIETIITVKNSYRIKPDYRKIFNKGYSTKGDSLTRGIGLPEVKKIIDKKDNVLLSTNFDQNNLFDITLTIL